MTQFDRSLRALVEGRVKFVVIGAVAAAARGLEQGTRDLDEALLEMNPEEK